MLAISERDNKIIMMNMIKDPVEKVDNMHESRNCVALKST